MKFMANFYLNGKLGHGVSESFITLISKVTNPNSIGNYRPISLVGSVYKVISKILANRLKKVVGEVIGEQQFAFV